MLEWFKAAIETLGDGPPRFQEVIIQFQLEEDPYFRFFSVKNVEVLAEFPYLPSVIEEEIRAYLVNKTMNHEIDIYI